MQCLQRYTETISMDHVLDNFSSMINTSTVCKISSADVVAWHRRLEHPGLKKTKKNKWCRDWRKNYWILHR